MKQPIKSWENKTIWLVGASSGIGLALARQLHAQGAHLIVSARDPQKLQNVKKILPEADTVSVDVCDAWSVQRAWEAILETHTHINAVIYLAGDYQPMSVSTINLAVAQRIIDINLKGALNVVTTVLAHLQSQSQAWLVLTASLAGLRGLPNSLAYGASKAGLIHLAECLAAELVDSTVDVRVVNPGFVKTQLTNKNKFTMPFLMTPDEAATAILKGLATTAFAIDFPKRFRWIFRVLGWLPDAVYFSVIKRLK